MSKQAVINGVWLGMSFDRAIEEVGKIMAANERWGEFNDMAMKRAYQNAERRLSQLQAAKAA